MRWLAVRISFVVALLLGIGMIATPTFAGAAASSCYGSSCEGLNPAETNCTEDAYTILSKRAKTESGDYGHHELRYSPKCHSNWVRFTPWYGAQAWLGNLAASAEVGGSPWIWRKDVSNSLRGTIGRSSATGAGITTWTAMVTADGVTCSSVDVYETSFSQYGGGDRRSLGVYGAPCIS
ncbi:MAG TPA: DUF2690 domain-containing protein [Candidatus Saccharimonadales bacterium]|nr:DUF2690 domain-containing protein [Candidatus Saccharimonadales bacterium]